MDFNLKDARPIWQQLADQMTKSIVTGEYLPGERFPSVRELALTAGVNPNTMQRSLSKLEEDRLLVTARTAGRTVTTDEGTIASIKKNLAEELAGEYAQEMNRLGFSFSEAAQLVSDYERREK